MHSKMMIYLQRFLGQKKLLAEGDEKGRNKNAIKSIYNRIFSV